SGTMSGGQSYAAGTSPNTVNSGGFPAAAPAFGSSNSGARVDSGTPDWQGALLREAQYRLERGEPAVMATLTRQFERVLLQTALDASRGRRVEAATRLGIGRNTITRKLRELG